MTERPGWSKPYVGCVHPGRWGARRFVVVFRGKDVYFKSWHQALAYANGLAGMVRSVERAS